MTSVEKEALVALFVAAEVLNAVGLAKGGYFDDKGRVDILGALRVALSIDPKARRGGRTCADPYLTAIDWLHTRLRNRGNGYHGASGVNDKPKTTKRDMVTLLRKTGFWAEDRFLKEIEHG